MAFGERGLSLAHFASRTDRHKAGHGIEEEIYLLRRYLSTLEASGELQYPFDVCKSERPDFLLTDHRGYCLGLEVTEATTMADQREMTLAGRKDTPTRLGNLGGRYRNGADGDIPERDVVADVLRATRRKSESFRKSDLPVEILIYANSNASFLCRTGETFSKLEKGLRRWLPHILRDTKIDRISVILSGQMARFSNARRLTDRFMTTYRLRSATEVVRQH